MDEVVGVCCASRKEKLIDGRKEDSEISRAGSRGAPVFERTPPSWRSLFRQDSELIKPGPTRSVSATDLGQDGRAV